MLTAMLSAVETLAPALAQELAPVRGNAVTPGLIDPRCSIPATERDTIIKNRAAILPCKGAGTTDEVANVILRLMPQASLTGDLVPSMRAGASCHTARARLETIDDQSVSRLARTPRTHPLCRSSDVSFSWPSSQERKTWHLRHGGRYTLVSGDAEPCRIALECVVEIGALTQGKSSGRAVAGMPCGAR
jgi:hypothetical protein